MVYTKHIIVHKLKHLRQAKDYVEKAEKTLVNESNPQHLTNLFPYISNPDKTMSMQLVSGHGITNVYDAANEFIATKKLKALAKGNEFNFDPKTGKIKFNIESLEKNNAVLAHHLIQSFSPDDDLTPEQVHEIGRQTILEFTGGEYEFVIATHVDREHIHNHIIFNSTNLYSGKQFDWKVIPKEKTKNGKAYDVTKNNFEKVSDKIASRYGAKIIEKSPGNSHLKYTKWQTQSIYKSQIKQRLDYLLEMSSDIDDFKRKSTALNLSFDFSGKWATYRLLDEPQMKNTRGRNLDKKHPEKYNLESIIERLKTNELSLTVDEVVERYEEKVDVVKQDFDYQVTVEKWQIDHMTSKGFYLNVDFGIADRGQIFIGGYKVDQLENGDCVLYLKKNETFRLLSEKEASFTKYLTGHDLAKQLGLYNGTVPLKKEPVISIINELVDAINFLAEHGVTEGTQFNNMESQLMGALGEAEEKLSIIDNKIMELTKIAKLLIEKESEQTQAAINELEELGVSPSIKYQDIHQELQSEKMSRKILKNKFEQTVDEINTFNEIKATQLEENKEKSEGKRI
ncbi:relaxase/mobilization nuclease domain-containing protein [Lactococcus lactis]|uniref:relaxase/mobilization nuclease domain-containing protein n=1 Tax=Lactococcus lactis TaxID=1358 RepID=UPI001F5A4464|nr:relaxase/mobilization nuclease domain-containing protein [Lactococcus lactis]